MEENSTDSLGKKDEKKMEMVLELTPDKMDSDRIRFMVGEEQIGFGYKSKESGIIFIRHCPKCGRENYAIVAPTGSCAFCGFNANPDE